MKRHAPSGLTWGCPYCAVGMQRALDSAIGLPRSSTSAAWMLVFLMPAEVSRSLMLPPGVTVSNWVLTQRLSGRAQLIVRRSHGRDIPEHSHVRLIVVESAARK